MVDLPVACSLSPGALNARRRNLLGKLVHRSIERHDLPNGYHLRFGPEAAIISAIVEMVDSERQCCRFLRFVITVDPDDRSLAGRAMTSRAFAELTETTEMTFSLCALWSPC